MSEKWSSCSSCGARVRVATRCPHCDTPSRGTWTATVAVAALGLTLGGCLTKSQPLYGATITDNVGTDGPTTESGLPESADTGAE